MAATTTTMPPIRVSLLVIPLACSCAAVPSAAPIQYNAQFETTLLVDFATRCVDSAFDPVDEQLAIGIEADIRQPNDDVGLELGLHHSWDDASRNVAGVGRVDFSADMTELSVGARWKYAEWGARVRPYASAGIAFLLASYSTDSATGGARSDRDWTIGPYVRAGLEWPATEHVSVALDYRQVLFSELFNDLSLANSNTDANYSQIGIVLGWKF